MDNLEKRVNDYINNELLNFNNIKSHNLIGKTQKEKYLNHLFSRRWSRKAQFPTAKEFTDDRVSTVLEKNLPFIFCYCFGGYKHFWTPTYPEPDYAEIFTIKYLIEYILPIAKEHQNKTTLEFESEEVALTYMNNTPQEGMDKYNKAFKKLLNFINKNLTYPIALNLVLARDFYDKEELLTKMYNYLPEVRERFNALNEEEKQIRLKRAETNIMWDGKEDLTSLSKEEKEQFIYDSRTLNEAFLDIDYELRGKEYFEKENLIPLLGTFCLGAGGEGWLHLASNKASMVDFWSGMGILEIREDKIIEKIISKKQYDLIKKDLIKISITSPLTNISNNYSYIYVYNGTLPF